MAKRKWLFLLSVLMLSMSLTACGAVGRYNSKPLAMSWPTIDPAR